MHLLLVSLIAILVTLTGCQHTHPVKSKNRPGRAMQKTEKEKIATGSTAHERQKQRFEQAKKEEPFLRSIKEMNFAELKVTKAYSIEKGDHPRVLAILKRMMATATDIDELKDVRIELADYSFDNGELEEAATQYEDFLSFYPGSDLVEYAKYKLILCTYYQTLDADRDQSKTKQTIEQAQQFLTRKDYQSYQADVGAIFKLCRNRLFENEISTFNYYLERHKLGAAEARLEQIKTAFNESRFNPTVLSLEIQLAQLQGNSSLCEEKKLALAAIDDDLAKRALEGQRIDAKTTPEEVKEILVAHGLDTGNVPEGVTKAFANLF